MKAVLAWAFAGAVTTSIALSFSGCTEVQKKGTDSGRKALATAVYYAQDVIRITEAVCTVDPNGKPCATLVKGVDAFFDAAQIVEDALARGEDAFAEAVSLEQYMLGLLAEATSFLKERT